MKLICDIPRIMIVSAASGGGKTTAVCAILGALERGGVKTAPFKCGPDYIDPLWHKEACGRLGVNLDLFFCDEAELKTVFAENSRGRDTAVIEGVMGCYDGISLESGRGSSYDVARALGCPIVLLLSARGMAYTAVPIIKGLSERFKNSLVKAVILNGVHKSVYERLKPVIERETGVAAAGFLPPLERSAKSRRLGLVLPEEDRDIKTYIDIVTELAAETIDMELLRKLSEGAKPFEYAPDEPRDGENVRIAVARDTAFCFYYKDNFDILRKHGAEILPFSPLRDSKLPGGCQGILIGGGYPELRAAELAENKEMLGDIKEKTARGVPCLAECGGFMYLHSELEGGDGKIYSGADVIKARAFKTERLARFGYIDISGGALSSCGSVKAHEFHYWDSAAPGSDCIAKKPSGRQWRCMHSRGGLFAGFPHLYYRSNEDFIKKFIGRCRREREREGTLNDGACDRRERERQIRLCRKPSRNAC